MKNIYKEHPSQANRILATAKGFSITDIQLKKLTELKAKIKLTDKQAEERDELELKLKRSKQPAPLSDGAKSRVKEVFLKDLYGLENDIWSKEMDKGNECEDESIKLFAKVSGNFGVKKNLETFENDLFIGTPDIITDTEIIDIKTSYNGLTFPWFDEEIPTPGYEIQLQVYMYLTGRRKAFLAYCLTDANEDAIQDEIRRETWRQKVIDVSQEKAEEIDKKVRLQMEYNRIPDILRVKVWAIEYDRKIIDKLIERVELCRVYYAELENQINNKLKN